MDPEKVEKMVDEFWKGKKENRVFADILPRQTGRRKKLVEETPLPAAEPEEIETPKPFNIQRRRRGGRFWFRFGLVLVIVALAAGGLLVFLPRADVTIILKQSPVSFEEVIEGRKDVFEVSSENGRLLIPAELLTGQKNLELLFPASGREEVSIKARGKLTVYNAFSSQSQVLVANTRFLSPDGMIFRLISQVTVPGAKVADGQIVPSSITVDVAADKAGADYDLEAESGQWRIPGFSGTPRYEKFYAEMATPLTGGFVGEKPVPTEDDIAQGRAKLEETLLNSLRNEMLAVEGGLVFLEGSASFNIAEVEVDEVADENGQFGIFAEAELKQIGFDEKILKDALAAKLKAPLTASLGYNLEGGEFAVEHGQPTADFNAGSIVWTVKGSVVFRPPFDADQFRREIVGLGEEELKDKAFDVVGLERAKISFWPFWVHRVPPRQSQVNVTVE